MVVVSVNEARLELGDKRRKERAERVARGGGGGGGRGQEVLLEVRGPPLEDRNQKVEQGRKVRHHVVFELGHPHVDGVQDTLLI